MLLALIPTTPVGMCPRWPADRLILPARFRALRGSRALRALVPLRLLMPARRRRRLIRSLRLLQPRLPHSPRPALAIPAVRPLLTIRSLQRRAMRSLRRRAMPPRRRRHRSPGLWAAGHARLRAGTPELRPGTSKLWPAGRAGLQPEHPAILGSKRRSGSKGLCAIGSLRVCTVSGVGLCPFGVVGPLRPQRTPRLRAERHAPGLWAASELRAERRTPGLRPAELRATGRSPGAGATGRARLQPTPGIQPGRSANLWAKR